MWRLLPRGISDSPNGVHTATQHEGLTISRPVPSLSPLLGLGTPMDSRPPHLSPHKPQG